MKYQILAIGYVIVSRPPAVYASFCKLPSESAESQGKGRCIAASSTCKSHFRSCPAAAA